MFSTAIILACAAGNLVQANLSAGSPKANINAAKALVGELMSYYNPSDNGVVPLPVWWWQSGGLWASMIHYWSYTNDSSYNDQVAAAIAAQAGSSQDFTGPSTIGNDDQLWWGLAAMTAAEYGLDASSTGSTWLQLTQNVFDTVSGRWDTSSCNGGLGWQISPSSSGYHYKNSISNGLLFQLAARLARYTGDSKYGDWAGEIFDWAQSVGLVEKGSYRVFDGTDDTIQCSQLDHDEWSYNTGVFLYGSAVMLDYTKNTTAWQAPLDGFISNVIAGFTANGVLQETKCEPTGSCNQDQLSFKAYVAQWLGATVALVPSTSDRILPILQASSEGALDSCNGGPNSDVCGSRWTSGGYDGAPGFGQQMAALEITQSLLASGSPLPHAASSKRTIASAFKA